MTYLTCPVCHYDGHHRVIDSRYGGMRRRRQCGNPDCEARWTTRERILPMRPEYKHRTPAKGQLTLGI